MLYELELENFKPFGTKQKLPLSRITLLYGPNSGGKSSVIQSLLLLRQTIEENLPTSSSLVPRGSWTDLGSFKSLIHRHQLKRELRYGLSYDRVPSERFYPAPPPDVSRKVELSYGSASAKGSKARDTSELRRVRYALNGGSELDATFLGSLKTVASREVAEWQRDSDHEFTLADNESVESLIDWYSSTIARRRPAGVPKKNQDEVWRGTEFSRSEAAELLVSSDIRTVGTLPARFLPHRGGPATIPEKVSGAAWNSLSRGLEGVAWELGELLRTVTYMGPLRVYPERHYVLAGGDSASVGSRGERMPEVIYRRGRQLEREINEWFDRFSIPYKLSVGKQGDEVTGDIVVLRLVDSRTETPVAPSDVGFGIGQLLPIVVEGCVASGRLMCVEQPEIHLHPRLQAHVADFLIHTSQVQKGRRSQVLQNQWIVETHSEALMLRLQRRVREGVIEPDDISVLYVEPSGPEGSVVITLRLDEDGEFIDPWPGGFFEESLTELMGPD